MNELPREKLIRSGAEALSDTELLAILLGTGTRGKGVAELANELRLLIDKNDYHVDIAKLLSLSGLGPAKAAVIHASIELSRRFLYPDKRKITSPKDILPLISHFEDRKQEHFLCLSLNGANEVKFVRTVSIGLVNRTLVHPREIYSDPIKDRAAAIVIAHNHPSGNLEPSQEDIEITGRIKQAGEILGIQLLDHIIFSENAYYSFLEEGKI